MNKSQQTILVPKIRFPEFKSMRGWHKEPLGSITVPINRRNSEDKALPIYSINNKEGFLPQSSQFDGMDSNARGYDTSLYKIVGKHTFAYNPARINIGSIGYSNELSEVLISSLYVCFQTNDRIDDNFFQYALTTPDFSQQVEDKSEGGIRSYLFYENFSRVILPFPQLPEQQKIADCLASIDALIAAENKKLEALKTHKNGLMQRLFPAEGKTVPEWRFPEFIGSGDWESGVFKKYIKLYRGSSPRPIENYQTRRNGVNWIKIGDAKNAVGFKINTVEEQITKEGAKKSRYVACGELVLANSMSYGRTYELDIEGYIYDGWFVLREYEQHFQKEFLLQQLNSVMLQNQYKSLSAGGVVQNISSDIVYATILQRPQYKEQEKIADCLTAIDDLVISLTHKINALNKHKAGLLQGLFPSAEEARE